jgi:hypothetical protein
MLSPGRDGAAAADGSTWFPDAHPTDTALPSTDARADATTDAPIQMPDAAAKEDGSVRDAFADCRIRISAASPSTSLTGLAAPGHLTVKGVINWGSTTPFEPSTWQWTVRDLAGQLIPTSTPTLYVGSSVVSFELPRAGGYDIEVSIGPSCSGWTRAWTVRAGQSSQSFFIRAMPPAAPLASEICGRDDDTRWCPSQDAVYGAEVRLIQTGDAPTADFLLARGTKVMIDPVDVIRDVMRIRVPAHISIEEHSATWRIQGQSGVNYQPFQATLKSGRSYDILIEPKWDGTGRQKPPIALLRQEPQEISPDSFVLLPGVGVNGQLSVGGAATPVPGARVWLRTENNTNTRIEQLSTAEWSDDYGLYGVRASKGALYSLFIAPPTGSPLPSVKVPNAIDLRQAADDTSITKIDFNWQAVATTNLTVTVLGLDGKDMADATVRIASLDDAWPNAGVLTIGTTTLPASGSVRREGKTGAKGVTFSKLPKGDYRITAVPPISMAAAAITTTKLALASAGETSSNSVRLVPKVRLSGQLTFPTKEAAVGTRVVAVDQGEDVVMEATSTTVDSSGNYELLLAPGRIYNIFAEPPPGKKLPMRVPLMVKQASQTDMPSLGSRRLPSGIAVSGQVAHRGIAATGGPQAVPGAVVQAFCYDTSSEGHSPACIYAQKVTPQVPLPLAEATTGSDGKYVLYLPEPGTGD